MEVIGRFLRERQRMASVAPSAEVTRMRVLALHGRAKPHGELQFYCTHRCGAKIERSAEALRVSHGPFLSLQVRFQYNAARVTGRTKARGVVYLCAR